MLDVGCGPGRHAHELARRGIAVHGIDISHRFVDLAAATRPPAPRSSGSTPAHLPFDGEFDAAISLCQGAFGLVTGDGEDAARPAPAWPGRCEPGGRLALSAFNAYFQVRYQRGRRFDAATGINHERTEVRDEAGEAKEVDLWTALLHAHASCACSWPTPACVVDALWSVEPGAYRAVRPDTRHRRNTCVVATEHELIGAGPGRC